MRDPNRIPMMLKRIQSVWEKAPDLRLGQLIIDSIPPYNKTDLFYLEDDYLLACVEDFDEKVLGVSKSQ